MAFLYVFFKRRGSVLIIYIYIYTIWPIHQPSQYIIVILSLHSLQVVSRQGRALEIWVFTLHTQERTRFLICRWLPSLKLAAARTWKIGRAPKGKAAGLRNIKFSGAILLVSGRIITLIYTLKDKVQAMVPFPDFVGWDDTREFPRSHSTTEPPPRNGARCVTSV